MTNLAASATSEASLLFGASVLGVACDGEARMTHADLQVLDGEAAWPTRTPSCWCVTDGRPGMENQAVGLAEAMGLTPVVKRVILRPPWRVLSPHITAFKRFAVSE